MNYKPELLAPVGSKDVLDAAIGEGADSVYLGVKDFNARARAKNFNYKELEASVDKLHALGKKVYVAVNTLFEEWEKERLYNLLKYLSLVKPDAVIVQDFGAIYLINKYFPELRIHASTQMNISSAKGINFLSKSSVKRVVLGRELTFTEIKDIKEKSGLELEVFIHGALCFSTSGLCLFSSFIDGKSGNRGLCTQPCRRLYKTEKKSGFFFSPGDIELLEYIPDLADIGITSFKIEGRMKSALYVANVVKAYRYLLDNYQNDKKGAILKARALLTFDMARNKTIFHFKDKNNFSFINPDEKNEAGLFLGKILETKKINDKKSALINTDFALSEDDQLRFTSHKDKLKKNAKAEILQADEKNFYLALPNGFSVNDKVYLVSSKALKRKYHQIIPKNLSKYKRHPGNKPAPETETIQFPKKTYLPDGLFVKLSRINDYYNAQTINPVMWILKLDKNILNELTSSKKTFPPKKENTIIELSPLFYSDDEIKMEEDIKKLLDAGYKNFIINNPGHFNFFKNKDAILIAGSYLYTLNSYSIKFLIEAGINFFITPMENNKRNLFAEIPEYNRKNCFVTLYSYPELFYVRGNLSKKYNFTFFKDKFDNSYEIKSLDEKSIIISEKPFSLTEKLEVFKKNNFSKFILDFTNFNVTKNECKIIKESLLKGMIIAKSVNFNWKRGFYKEVTKIEKQNPL